MKKRLLILGICLFAILPYFLLNENTPPEIELPSNLVNPVISPDGKLQLVSKATFRKIDEKSGEKYFSWKVEILKEDGSPISGKRGSVVISLLESEWGSQVLIWKSENVFSMDSKKKIIIEGRIMEIRDKGDSRFLLSGYRRISNKHNRQDVQEYTYCPDLVGMTEEWYIGGEFKQYGIHYYDEKLFLMVFSPGSSRLGYSASLFSYSNKKKNKIKHTYYSKSEFEKLKDVASSESISRAKDYFLAYESIWRKDANKKTHINRKSN